MIANDIFVISEYCFHGNLKDYLTRNRDYYVDELDPVTRDIKPDSQLAFKVKSF